MQISSTKLEGQKILQKLRSFEHVWLTAFNRSKQRMRVKIELYDGDYYHLEEVLCLIDQRLHIMHVYAQLGGKNLHVFDEYRHAYVKPKYVFGRLTQRETKS